MYAALPNPFCYQRSTNKQLCCLIGTQVAERSYSLPASLLWGWDVNLGHGERGSGRVERGSAQARGAVEGVAAGAWVAVGGPRGAAEPFAAVPVEVEGGERQPSLGALFGVAKAYGVTLSSLFEPEPEAESVFVVRRSEGGLQKGNGLFYANLSRGSWVFNLQPMRMVVPAGSE